MQREIVIKSATVLVLAACTAFYACGDNGETTFESVGVEREAIHSWGPYHWARTSDNFRLTVVNSLTADWDRYLGAAVDDWSSSLRLDQVEQAGSDDRRTRRRCRAPNGQVRVCNYAYGNTGWLGIASISIDSQNHITGGYTKLNDTYFSRDYYNNDAWKQSVTCQELGHNIGLGHQDEDFNNNPLKSCMDYQDPPWPTPNAHDYEQLNSIYDHFDSYNSYAAAASGAAPKVATFGEQRADWGESVGRHGQAETFVRSKKNGGLVVTHVFWIEGH